MSVEISIELLEPRAERVNQAHLYRSIHYTLRSLPLVFCFSSSLLSGGVFVCDWRWIPCCSLSDGNVFSLSFSFFFLLIPSVSPAGASAETIDE